MVIVALVVVACGELSMRLALFLCLNYCRQEVVRVVDDDGPVWVKECDCGGEVENYRGDGDVSCGGCGAWFNAFGQRLRDDWRDNPAWRYDGVGDAEGFEIASADVDLY